VKICLISFHSCPYSSLGGNGSGGMSVYLKELTSALVGYPEVRVDIFTRARTAICVEAKDVSPQIRVIQLKAGPNHAIDRTDIYEYIPEFSDNMADFIYREEEKYDIIHSHYWLSGLAGITLKNEMEVPLVHTYHTLGFMKKQVLGQREHRCRANSEQHLAHLSDSIISPSLEEKEYLINKYGIPSAKVDVVYPGVNARLFYPVRSQNVWREVRKGVDDFVLLYVGRIDPVKGLVNLVKALKFIKENNPSLFRKVRVIVIGGGNKKEELSSNEELRRIKEMSDQNGLQDKLSFLGSVDHLQLKKYYSAADALVIPSLYESFGLVAVEALACGIPVIASQIGQLKAIVREGKNGFSFSPHDPFSLFRSIEKFHVERDGLWNQESIRGDVIRRFSWDKTAEETYRIFKRLQPENLSPKTIFRLDENPQRA
jgi:D-inositol-3-phosphate glycosyltransferase